MSQPAPHKEVHQHSQDYDAEHNKVCEQDERHRTWTPLSSFSPPRLERAHLTSLRHACNTTVTIRRRMANFRSLRGRANRECGSM